MPTRCLDTAVLAQGRGGGTVVGRSDTSPAHTPAPPPPRSPSSVDTSGHPPSPARTGRGACARISVQSTSGGASAPRQPPKPPPPAPPHATTDGHRHCPYDGKTRGNPPSQGLASHADRTPCERAARWRPSGDWGAWDPKPAVVHPPPPYPTPKPPAPPNTLKSRWNTQVTRGIGTHKSTRSQKGGRGGGGSHGKALGRTGLPLPRGVRHTAPECPADRYTAVRATYVQ